VKLRIPLAPERIRSLDAADMLRARIGRAYWATSFDKIPRKLEHRVPLGEFIKNVHEHHEAGEGLLMFGDYGSGKTSGGVLILKEVIARGGTALMTPSERISSAVIEKTTFDGEETIWERMQDVDMLLIDDLRREHVKDFGRSVIESLIRRRYDQRLPTLVTTNADMDELVRRYEAAMAALGERCQPILFDGVNWRDGDGPASAATVRK